MRTAKGRTKVAGVVVAMSTALLPVLFNSSPAQAASPPGVSQSEATKVGTFSFADMGSAPSGAHSAQAPPHQPPNKTLRHTTAAQVPRGPGYPGRQRPRRGHGLQRPG